MFVLSCPCDDDKESRIVITSAIVVGDGALSVSPEGVEEAVVGTSTGGRGARSQVALLCSSSFEDEVQWGSKSCGGCAESEENGREGDHD